MIRIALQDSGDQVCEGDRTCSSFCIARTELFACVLVDDLYGMSDDLGALCLSVSDFKDFAFLSLAVIGTRQGC